MENAVESSWISRRAPPSFTIPGIDVQFDFATATRIAFGRGRIRKLPEYLSNSFLDGFEARTSERRALVVTGRNAGRAQAVLEALETLHVPFQQLAISGEPTTEQASRGVALAREFGAHLVIGIGGGSALDAGKAIAALLTNGGDPLDYLEVVGQGKALTSPAAPYIAIPTTSGTGSEVTKNAVLASNEHKVKVSLRHESMLPRLALLDPELTHSVPPDITAATGLDALTQVVEPFVSNQANALTDGLCREGIRRGARSLLRAYRDGNDADAREDMAMTSLFGGLALANAKLGAVHGFAGAIGGMFQAPHGAVCARLLPLVMRANLAALRQREAENLIIDRYREIAVLFTGRGDAYAEDGIEWVVELCRELAIPGFEAYGMTACHLAAVVEKAQRASSMKGNPIVLAPDELYAILDAAL